MAFPRLAADRLMMNPMYLAALLASGLAAVEPPLVNRAPRPRLEVPHAATAPLLTAVMDDPAWAHAVRAALAPSLATAPVAVPPATAALLLWDADRLYIRFLCRDDDIRLPVSGHDADLYRGDVVEVFLDPLGDQRQTMELQVNAANDTLDALWLCTGVPVHDQQLMMDDAVAARDVWDFRSWDWPGLMTAAAPWRDGESRVGWIVDIAIPAQATLRRLGTANFRAGLELRANLIRYDGYSTTDGAETLLSLDWSPVMHGNPHRSPAAMGTLVLSEP